MKIKALYLMVIFLANTSQAYDRSCLDFKWIQRTSQLEIVGDINQLRDLFKHPEKYGRDDYVKIIDETYDLGSRLKIDIYEYRRLGLVETFKALPSNFRVLLLDAGVTNHASEFAEFVEKNLSWSSPWQLREAFAKSLGTITVFRGLALHPNQKKQIEKVGMRCSTFCKSRYRDSSRPVESFLLHDLTAEITDHVNMVDGSILMSVSEHREIAMAVAVAQKKASETRKSAYLFTLKIPKIDVITDDFTVGMMNGINEFGIKINGTDYLFTDGIERFVKFIILPSEIINVELIPGIMEFENLESNSFDEDFY